jgi:hypothetical protein
MFEKGASFVDVQYICMCKHVHGVTNIAWWNRAGYELLAPLLELVARSEPRIYYILLLQLRLKLFECSYCLCKESNTLRKA